ncbi:hypothetical protein [Pandoraea communis]|uniref:hypothetical protein n=1 Tax=Pandoraea communis TaxID=2508297 RepID=UPI0025A5ECCC|nr:hypothetical protein [Pandoraea communis]MDM8356588.1 hypothetical protein [Pandoraea communis]
MAFATDFKPIRPSANAAVDAFLSKCHPGSRKAGSVRTIGDSQFSAVQEIRTVAGDQILVFLDCPPTGGWRVCAYEKPMGNT